MTDIRFVCWCFEHFTTHHYIWTVPVRLTDRKSNGYFNASNRLKPFQGTNAPLPLHRARHLSRNRILHDIYYFFCIHKIFSHFLKNGGGGGRLITLWRHRCQHTVDADDCVCWSARKTSGDVQLIRSWPACDEHSLEFSSSTCVPTEERDAAFSIATGQRERVVSSVQF